MLRKRLLILGLITALFGVPLAPGEPAQAQSVYDPLGIVGAFVGLTLILSVPYFAFEIEEDAAVEEFPNLNAFVLGVDSVALAGGIVMLSAAHLADDEDARLALYISGGIITVIALTGTILGGIVVAKPNSIEGPPTMTAPTANGMSLSFRF